MGGIPIQDDCNWGQGQFFGVTVYQKPLAVVRDEILLSVERHDSHSCGEQWDRDPDLVDRFSIRSRSHRNRHQLLVIRNVEQFAAIPPPAYLSAAVSRNRLFAT